MSKKKSRTPKQIADILPNILKKTQLRWQIPQSSEYDPSAVEIALRERIKELNCLYGISQLAENGPESMEVFLKQVVDIIPPSWQYPEITCGQISFNGNVYKTSKFIATNWRQSAKIIVFGIPSGEVEVFYTKECPPDFEGPFLKEERTLLNAIAERISAVAMRLSAEKQLKETNKQLLLERQALQETNIALKTIMARIEEEKQTAYKDIRSNIEKIVMPIIYTLQTETDGTVKNYIELLRKNLTEITSPFINQLTDKHTQLSPTEISICNMIRNGLSSKEIAQLRSVAPATVNRHRERIRKKLGISNTNTNLISYLRSIM